MFAFAAYHLRLQTKENQACQFPEITDFLQAFYCLYKDNAPKTKYILATILISMLFAKERKQKQNKNPTSTADTTKRGPSITGSKEAWTFIGIYIEMSLLTNLNSQKQLNK